MEVRSLCSGFGRDLHNTQIIRSILFEFALHGLDEPLGNPISPKPLPVQPRLCRSARDSRTPVFASGPYQANQYEHVSSHSCGDDFRSFDSSGLQCEADGRLHFREPDHELFLLAVRG